MRVLVLTEKVPSFPGSGATTRTYCLYRELAHRHEITFLIPESNGQKPNNTNDLRSFSKVLLATSDSNDPSDSPKPRRTNDWTSVRLNSRSRVKSAKFPKRLQYWAKFIEPIRGALQQLDLGGYDLVQIEHSPLAYTVQGLDLPIPLNITWHNLYHFMYYRKFRSSPDLRYKLRDWIDYFHLWRYEGKIARTFHKSIVMSDLDRERLRNICPTADISIVPNGVDLSYFHNSKPDWSDSGKLVFIGTLDYLPNIEGVQYFCSQILPALLRQYPNLKFYIVGSRPTDAVIRLSSLYPSNVIVTGTVKDVRPYLTGATICVVPLLNGSGTRLKILEALAMRRPIVSTTIGCEGLNLQHEEDIWIADDAEDFITSLLFLLENSKTRKRIARRGYQTVKRYYDWKLIADVQEMAWQEVMNGDH